MTVMDPESATATLAGLIAHLRSLLRSLLGGSGKASLTAHLRDGLCGSLRQDVVLCVMLEPRYGGPGAAAATSISLAFETALSFWIVRQRLGLHVLAFGKRTVAG